MFRPVHDQRGVVALLTTVFVAILISVITVSLAKQMVGELRQAGDYEQSQRAYYAARAGIEDAAATLVADYSSGKLVTAQESCSDALGTFHDLTKNVASASAVDVGWTCQRILVDTLTHTGKLNGPDAATQLDMSSSTKAYDSVAFSWDKSAATRSIPGSSFPDYNTWVSGNYPAPLEVTVIAYPKGNFSDVSKITTANALFMPASSGSSKAISGLIGNNPISAKCVASTSDYHCSASLTGFDTTNNSYILRIRTRYTGTDYQVGFLGGGSPVAEPDGTATLDVTGKSGAAYRRLIYRLPYTRGASTGLDYVIYGDNGVNKQCKIDTDPTLAPTCP
jgi:Tfp pilus assembly protein PilX